MVKKVDLTGQRFGKLVVVNKTKKRSGTNVIWRCKCDCGNAHEVTYANLITGSTGSCGCNGGKSGKQLIEANELKNWKEDTALQLLQQKIRVNNTSGVKGVSWHKNENKWISQLRFKGVLYFLGYFDKLEDAAKARKEAEEKYFTPILEKYGRLEEAK